MSKKEKIFLFLIFVLTLVIRIWNVRNHPTFISDEASIGYNAYSVLKTGKDEWGNFLPLSFKAFGEYKLPVYIYTAVPFIAIFGLNEFAVRLPSVVFGSLTIVVLYFLTKSLISPKHSLLSLFISFFLAILPWHIQTSRMALEANLSLFILVLATFLFIKGKNRKLYLYLSIIFFGLSLYTYNSCRVFTVLLLPYLILVLTKSELLLNKKIIMFPLILFLLFVSLLFLSGFRGTKERLSQVGIFANPGILAHINEKRTTCLESKPYIFCKLIFNRPAYYSYLYIKNYFSHFSPRFLFLKGSELAQYNVPNRGLVYIFQLPLIVLGIFWLYKNEKKLFLIFLFWALISPLANSFTGEAHPVRAIFLAICLPVFGAGGVYAILNFIFKKNYRIIFLYILLFVSFFNFGKFLIDYFIYYPQEHTSTWQSGYKALYQELNLIENDYDEILVSKFYGEPHIFYLFYNKYNPKIYQEGKKIIRYERNDKWVNVDRIGKYYFVQDWNKENLKPNQLIAFSPKEANLKPRLLKEIKYQDNTTSFIIGIVQ